MATLYLTYVNYTKNYIFGEETVQDIDTAGLFRRLQNEYGRCVSKVYRERADQSDKPVGWTFVKKDEYTDTHESYLREVWAVVEE